MIEGSNWVEEYQPVQAYSVEVSSNGIISGGGGDEAIVSEGTTFYWRYDPNDEISSGFTGVGWFEDIGGSPIVVSGKSLDAILAEFENGSRTNLNDVFEAWQKYVSDHPGTVSSFVNTLVAGGGGGCWSM